AVYASPFCRTMETARLAFHQAQRLAEARGGPANDPERYEPLRKLLATKPPAGKNAVIASHAHPSYEPFGTRHRAGGVRPVPALGERLTLHFPAPFAHAHVDHVARLHFMRGLGAHAIQLHTAGDHRLLREAARLEEARRPEPFVQPHQALVTTPTGHETPVPPSPQYPAGFLPRYCWW